MEAPSPASSAHIVADSFVKNYYIILHQTPWLAHQFYQDISTLGRPVEDGSLSVTTTMDAINAKILSLNYGDLSTEIRSINVQESLNGGIVVLVTGYITGKDTILKNFSQLFVLAPHDNGYFVLNDMFRYMENANHHKGDHAPTLPTFGKVPVFPPVSEYNVRKRSERSFPTEAVITLSPEAVGKCFVKYYYTTLRYSPWQLHRFYKDISTFGRSEEDGSFSVTTTMDAINAKILSLNYGDFNTDIRSVDVQESLHGGINVLVTGYLIGKDNIQKFTQLLFLAPQGRGYFVLNDMFRCMEIDKRHEGDHASPRVALEKAPRCIPLPENNISYRSLMRFPAEARARTITLSAQVAGKCFVKYYYTILQHFPWKLHQLYKDNSSLGRFEEDGSFSLTTTVDAINAKILSLNNGEVSIEIISIDVQELRIGGISALATGYLIGKDNIPQNFCQSFVLAPKGNGYFLLNDMLSYTKDANHHEGCSHPVII